MSPDFNLHYDRLRENDPTKPENRATDAGIPYDTPNNTRVLCLSWPDGRRQFLSYAYLVGGTFTPGDEMNEITLDFSSYIVSLEGFKLEGIFEAILNQIPLLIVQNDARHILALGEQELIVRKMAVFKKQ